MRTLPLTYKTKRATKGLHGNVYKFPKKGAVLNQFGFNGQLKDNEIYGEGNAYTAEFWEYDPRSIRRRNRDPVVKPWKSPYAAFGNNPILLADPNGDDAEVADPPGKRNKSKNTNEGFHKKKLYSELPRVLIKKDDFEVTYTKENTLLEPTTYNADTNPIELKAGEYAAPSPETKKIGFDFDVDIYKSTADIKISRKNLKGKEKTIFEVKNVSGPVQTPMYKVNRQFAIKNNFKIEVTYRQNPISTENETTFEIPGGGTMTVAAVVTIESTITYKVRKTLHTTPERIDYLKDKNIIER